MQTESTGSTVHGLAYGIDSDGSWPFGTQATDGRRSDEICPGQSWTYVFDVKEGMIGIWPFHDHYRRITDSANRGLFGAVIVLPNEIKGPPKLGSPPALKKVLRESLSDPGLSGHASQTLSAIGIQREAEMEFMKHWLKHREFHAPQSNEVLHVPLFYHVMNGSGRSGFGIGDLHFMETFEVTFGTEGEFRYHSTSSHHGRYG